MRVIYSLIPAILLLAAGASAGAPQEPSPYRPVATVLQLMEAIIIPSSDIVWNAGLEPPATDEAWTRIRNNALALAESGNLLMMPPRARDTGDWKTESEAMIDASVAAIRAVEARNVNALLDAGDALYESCANCHAKYMQ